MLQSCRRAHPDDLMALKASDRACIDGLTHRSIAEYRYDVKAALLGG
jgi:hypothetical protein